jgi:MinD-like ATPase involved in chromosome partitioning or flagellar assembly
VPLERRGRPPADPQESAAEPEPGDEYRDEPEAEATDDGLDWLREHFEARAAGGVIGAGGPLPPLSGDPSPPPVAGEPPPPAGESFPGEPSAPEVEAPAVRRLREASAELDDGPDGPDEPGAASEAGGAPGRGADPPADPARSGRAPSIRPAPTPPAIRPASSLQPPGRSLPVEARSEEPEPPAAAAPPPAAEPPPAAGRSLRPPTPAELAGDWAKEEPPLPGWDDLSPERLLNRQPGGPISGWQGFVHRLTKGRIRPRPGRAERAKRELEGRIATPITGCRRVAVFTLKGGVGKTTTTVGLGATFATYRADRIVAVDGSPDAGTLHARVRGGEGRSPRDLIAGASSLARYADVRANITQTPTGLEVVASTMDPSISEGFNENDYRKIAAILERFYSLILTDCGPGALHSVIWPVLRQADQLVIVCAPSVDGARSASLTLDWLEEHHFEKLARSAVVVLNAVRPKAAVNLAQLEEHFTRRCRAVVQVPFDRHLETGAEITLAELAPATREAWLRLGAAVADGFGATARAEAEGRQPLDRRA